MVYRVIGLMSGSSLDGLDIVFAEFEVNGQKWTYNVIFSECYAYSNEWVEKLKTATTLSALDYMQLHADYGHYLGKEVNRFITFNKLEYQVQMITSHGHTTFHSPSSKMTHQLGEAAAIAAVTGINVVSDLRAMDVALGGQGAPIVPIGEKLLLPGFDYFLNLGGIANISANTTPYTAFDICPANRVLNMLSLKLGKEYDEGGSFAKTGLVKNDLLQQLNALDYYKLPYPKSLANDFGTNIVFPIIINSRYTTEDCLCTYVEHIAVQISKAITQINLITIEEKKKLLVTGGGAFNTFLIQRIEHYLPHIEIIIPDETLLKNKEAIIMAFIGLLRWREENNVLSSVTGSDRDSIGGAVWIGQEW
jgi:anhydro-N-acetylmuramic acid kinase